MEGVSTIRPRRLTTNASEYEGAINRVLGDRGGRDRVSSLGRVGALAVVFGFGAAALSMPAFGSSYTDDDIAAVANYVTARFGSKGSKLTGKDVADLRKQTAE